MKGMKGKFLKKMKTIKSIGYLKPDRILLVNSADGFFYTSPAKSNLEVQKNQNQSICRGDKEEEEEEEEAKKKRKSMEAVQEPEIIDVTELMKDLEDDEIDEKENIKPKFKAKEPNPVDSKNESKDSRVDDRKTPLKELDVMSFRPPDLDSASLFDPNLLAAFERAVMEVKSQQAERRARIEESSIHDTLDKEEEEEEEEEAPLKYRRIEENPNPLWDFEEKCPPGACDSVVLYTTGLSGIRRTYEHCNSVRFLLQSFRIMFYERDVSLHSEFREELWRVLGERVVPPRLFIKGRYIGGAEEVLTLHEQGKLRPLFAGVPDNRSEGPCEGCAGVGFIMCYRCSGSHRIGCSEGGGEGKGMVWVKCSECNENGLTICPICC